MKTPKISMQERIDAYKYYNPYIGLKELKVFIKTGFAENQIIKERWKNKKKRSLDEKIFASHVDGKSYAELVDQYDVSLRFITKSINLVRKQLIDEINLDIKNGHLIYIEPIQKQRAKGQRQLVNHWKKHINNDLEFKGLME